jgi:thiamine kinase-like enzyme
MDMIDRLAQSLGDLHAVHAKDDTVDFDKMLTYIHGDAHPGNIFYDHLSKTITLVDNSTFGLGYPDEDLSKIIYSLPSKNMKNRFVNSYVTSFKEGSRKTIRQYLLKKYSIQPLD